MTIHDLKKELDQFSDDQMEILIRLKHQDTEIGIDLTGCERVENLVGIPILVIDLPTIHLHDAITRLIMETLKHPEMKKILNKEAKKIYDEGFISGFQEFYQDES